MDITKAMALIHENYKKMVEYPLDTEQTREDYANSDAAASGIKYECWLKTVNPLEYDTYAELLCDLQQAYAYLIRVANLRDVNVLKAVTLARFIVKNDGRAYRLTDNELRETIVQIWMMFHADDTTAQMLDKIDEYITVY